MEEDENLGGSETVRGKKLKGGGGEGRKVGSAKFRSRLLPACKKRNAKDSGTHTLHHLRQLALQMGNRGAPRTNMAGARSN